MHTRRVGWLMFVTALCLCFAVVVWPHLTSDQSHSESVRPSSGRVAALSAEPAGSAKLSTFLADGQASHKSYADDRSLENGPLGILGSACDIPALCSFAATGDLSHLTASAQSTRCDIRCATAIWEKLSVRSLGQQDYAALGDWLLRYLHNDALVIRLSAMLELPDSAQLAAIRLRAAESSQSLSFNERSELARLGVLPMSTGESPAVRSQNLADITLENAIRAAKGDEGDAATAHLSLAELLALAASPEFAANSTLVRHLLVSASTATTKASVWSLLNTAEKNPNPLFDSVLKSWAQGQLSGERFEWLLAWANSAQASPNTTRVVRLALKNAEDAASGTYWSMKLGG